MYSKQESSKQTDVRLGVDKGSLRLQFNSRVSQQFYGKRQKYIGLGRSDTNDNRNWAEGITRRIQKDIDYQNGINFDPTLNKYLELKSNVVNLPGSLPIPTLKELWEEYVNWKVDTKQISNGTRIGRYEGSFVYLLKNYLNKPLTEELAQTIIDDLCARRTNSDSIGKLFSALSSMSQRAINNGTLKKDYFAEIKKFYKPQKKSKQLQEEEDCRAYTIKERNLIINSFYSSQKPSFRQLAELIEFLFLTGCRPGEAFALEWRHINLDKGWIRFEDAYSSVSKEIKETKTNVIRIFKFKKNSRLAMLIDRLNTANKNCSGTDLLFTKLNGKRVSLDTLAGVWDKKYSEGRVYNGIVTTLVNEGKLQYLKPYSTRHTFISIQANNGTDLALLADVCGTSVDKIMKHYLQPDKQRELADI
ncbi:integrase [Nostoc sp. CENA543]|uniref:tyrosine-type recombinase/integrase n=1 Tax=Nostoc sp. CENA543 TaxID=1869241 RepID=UPI000CA1D998|nr:tyrosine-type recombinase/integrase [Nostoc sp. CENA543]AUT03574.1 integrase [Nostoc sp. CENA543]